MKKISAILLALIMMLSMVAMAATLTVNTTNTNGDTNDAQETYTAYQILTADSTGTVYTINKNDEWYSVLSAAEQTWLTLTPTANDANVYSVTLKAENSDATAKALAAYLAQNTTGKTAITLNVGDNEVNDGYYLVTTSMGSALVLDTYKTETVAVKNSYPTITKAVDKNNATIGTNVKFTITVVVPATVSSDVTIHDVMEDSFTLVGDITAKIGDGEATVIASDAAKDHEGCTYEFTFAASAVAGKTVVIEYTAELDKDADIFGEQDPDNQNVAYVTYSNFTSTEEIVKVETYEFTFTKVDGKDKTTALPGAEFKLTAADKTTEIKVVKVADGQYRVADTTETAQAATIVTPADGKVEIEGLATGTYYLYETKAPTGYNLMTAPFEIKIEDGNVAEGTYKVENNQGSELPSTGGIGTTIFYTVGGLMMAAAIVLLVAKKKVAASK